MYWLNAKALWHGAPATYQAFVQTAVTHHYLCVLLLFIVCLAGDVWVWLLDGQQRTSAVTPTHQLRLYQGEYTHHHVR